MGSRFALTVPVCPTVQLLRSASSTAYVGQNCPAGGPPLQVPSDSPGRLIHRNASTSVWRVVVVGLAPSARSGGLHQALSPAGPAPLRLVSITHGVRARRATPTAWP